MEPLQNTTPISANSQDFQIGASPRLLSPISTLPKSLEFVGKINDAFGSGAYTANTDIAKALNLSENSIKSTLSTAQQYGLLENRHGKGYKVTDLFHHILRPVDDADYKAAVTRSLNQQEIFRRLLADYTGKVLPSKDGLKNLLVRDFKMIENSAVRTADIFLQNLNAYNLLNRHGVIQMDLPKAAAEPVETKDEIPDKNQDVRANTPQANGQKSESENPIQSNEIRIPVPLKSSDDGSIRIAFIVLPDDYNDADLSKISRIALAYREGDSA